MRLICGILRLDGAPAAESALKRMAAAMTAPGLTPMLMLRVEGLLGLAVLDFSGEGEGVAECDDWLIAADLRLDRAEIQDEALLEAARRYGPDFPDHLNGDFAVALWQREKNVLLLGRDFIGVRPLAWTWQPGRWFAFASLPKGLHGSGLAADTVDPVAIAAKISNTYFTGSDSGFAEISYLQAGHSLCVSPHDTIAPRPHRAYRPCPSQVGSWRGTTDDAADVLQRLVEEAVAARMPSTGPVACHLTGGLDSSAITVLAAREARRHSGGVLTLTMMAAEPMGPTELDERPLISAVLAQERDIAHRTVADLLPMPGGEADPDWPGSVIGGPDDEMMAAAVAFGADRLLSGVGGDEGASYNGANLYVALLRAGRLPSLMQELALRAKSDDVSLLRTIRNRVIVPLIPAILRRRRRAGVMDKKRGAVRYLGASIQERVAMRRMPPVLHSNRATDRVRAFADHHIPSRCTFYAIMAARHGLAVSFPLLDRRIVDFVLSLPVRLFLADGQSRQPFRRAMRGILPDPVRLSRHKVGLFDDRFVRYASKREHLLTMLETLHANASPLVREMFDFDAIRAGLELLPQPYEAGRVVRSAPGGLINGNPAWVAVFGVGCLIAAWDISRKADSGRIGPV